MKAKARGQSDVGLVRAANEDSFLVDEATGLFIVCDGMGGHQAGDVASSNAVRSVAAFIQQHAQRVQEGAAEELPQRAQSLVQQAIRHASDELCQLGSQHQHLHGMGTTIGLLWIAGTQAVVAHVGDSRVYLYREGMQQLTEDHTLINDLIACRAIDPQAARHSVFGHILTRSLGRSENLAIDTRLVPLQIGDRFLLCTDGLTNYVEATEELERLVQGPLDEVPARLIELARQRGGADNITAVVVDIEGE